MLRLLLPILLMLANNLLGCTNQPVRNVSFQAVAQSKSRHPAGDFPPNATRKTGWVFSWTNNPLAATDLRQYLDQQVGHAQKCLDLLSKSEQTVPGCEGNGMAAGPGLYACDNPFLSHDYGATLISLSLSSSGKSSIALATGKYTPPPANGGLNRSIYANPNPGAIMYEFRATDANDRALVIRNSDLFDASLSYATNLDQIQYQRLQDHKAFACTSSTSIKDVITQWGDQIDFLAITYNAFSDPTQGGFVENGELNSYGVAAAIASDAVAAPESVIRAEIQKLFSRSTDLKDSLSNDSCQETASQSPRACLARRIFSSLANDDGTPNSPTYSFALEDMLPILRELNLLSNVDPGALRSRDDLRLALYAEFVKHTQQVTRAKEAFQCMISVRNQAQAWQFGSWGDDPQ